MIDHKALKDALRTINDTQPLVEAEKEKYNAAIKNIEANAQYTAPAFLQRQKDEAKKNYDSVVNRLMGNMRNALEVVKANNDFSGETVDFENPKFQSAVKFIDTMGKDMEPVDQLNIINQFRGCPAELKAIGTKFKSKGMYFADEVQELTKNIPSIAIENTEHVLSRYEYNGTADFGEMFFNRQDFRNQAARFGYDLGTATNPYISALQDERKRIPRLDENADPKDKAKRDFAEYKITTALKKMSEGGEDSIEEIFSSTIKALENWSYDEAFGQ